MDRSFCIIDLHKMDDPGNIDKTDHKEKYCHFINSFIKIYISSQMHMHAIIPLFLENRNTIPLCLKGKNLLTNVTLHILLFISVN